MTREEKLITMRMVDLVNVAEKLGIKINKKGSKEVAIKKILEAEQAGVTPKTDKPKVKKETADAKIDKALAVKTEEAPVAAKIEAPAKADKKPAKKANLRLTELTYGGLTKPIRVWAEEIGMPTPTLYDRVNRNGWSVEEALTTPLGERRHR